MELEQLAGRIRDLADPDALQSALVELIEIETPSHDPAASAAIADLLTRRWSAVGDVRTVHTAVGAHILVEVAGRGALADAAPIVLLGHSDTVWPVGTLATTVPLVVADGVLRGPGSYDMKAGLVVMETAVRALGRLGEDHRPLRVLIAADEEVGSRSATPLVREACAGAVAVLGFESPHPDGSLKVGRLGSTRARLQVVGRESHAALDPGAGVSAIDELLDQLLALRAAVARIADRRPGEVLINVGAVSGGGRTNVVPGCAEALIGFRFATTAAESDVLEALHSLAPVRAGAQVDIEILSSRPAWQAGAGDADLLGRIARLGAAAGLSVTGRPAAGAADTNTTGALGIPSVDGLGPRGGGAHATSEHVRLDSLADRVVLLTLVLAGLI